MKIVIDMNLSPQWIAVLGSAGHECVHWSEVGSADALDWGNHVLGAIQWLCCLNT
jgi:predicted nuclease of predicted toxin-antitoxin system